MLRHELTNTNTIARPDPNRTNTPEELQLTTRQSAVAIKQLWQSDTDINDRLKKLEKKSSVHWFTDLLVYNDNKRTVLPTRLVQAGTGDSGLCIALEGDETQSYGIGIDNSDGNLLKIAPNCPITDDHYLTMNPSGEIRVNQGVYISDFSDDETFADLSDSALVTERAIGAYIAAVTYWDRDAVLGNLYPRTLTDSVGIGTIVPDSLLEVWDDNAHPVITITASANGIIDPQIKFRVHDTEDIVFSMGVDGLNDFFKIFSGDGVGDTTEFVIDDGGRVGIGAAAPASLLEVYSSTTHPVVTISALHANAYDPQIRFRTDNPLTTKFSIGVDSADDFLKIYPGAGIGGTTEFVIGSNGVVYLGTDTPVMAGFDGPLQVLSAPGITGGAISARSNTSAKLCSVDTINNLGVKMQIGVGGSTRVDQENWGIIGVDEKEGQDPAGIKIVTETASPVVINMGGFAAANEIARWQTSGYYGLGTAAPVSLFEMWDDNADPILTITAQHNTDYDPQIQFRTDAAPTTKWSLRVDGTNDNLYIDYIAGGGYVVFDTDQAKVLEIGANSAGIDYYIEFNGQSNNGIIRWMEDEDYFQFDDDILMLNQERIYFDSTDTYIGANADDPEDLVIAADQDIILEADGNVNINNAYTIPNADGATDEVLTTDGAGVVTFEPVPPVAPTSVRITNADSPYAAIAGVYVIFADTDGGAIEVDLPAGSAAYQYKLISCGSSGNDLTVDPNVAEQLFGAGAGVASTVSDGEIININYNATEGWW